MADADLASGPSRIVAGGLRVRSLAAVLNDSGVMQAYASPHGLATASYDVFRDSPNQCIYTKGSTATVRYYPFDETELLFAKLSDTNRIRLNHHIGVMFKGSPSTAYDVEYSLTFEYISTANTDLVPHVYGPVGDPRKVLGDITNINRAASNTPSSLDNLINIAHGISRVVSHTAG